MVLGYQVTREIMSEWINKFIILNKNNKKNVKIKVGGHSYSTFMMYKLVTRRTE